MKLPTNRSFLTLLVMLSAGALVGRAGPGPLPAVELDGTPLRLTCEHRVNPLGIDTVSPRLSWWVGDGRPDAVQTAYEIRVANTEAGLARTGDVWESGKVRSAESVDVVYGGPALQSGQRCYWSVRTWDGQDQPSGWSKPAFWEIGLLRPSDWTAKWIASPPRDTSVSAPAIHLRKMLRVEAPVRSARIYVTARGLFELRLNGKRVGEDYLTPGWTDFHKRNQYLTYDVTAGLTKGANVLGAVLADGWHNGNLLLIGGGKKNWYGDDTSLLVQLVIEYRDGRRQIVGTDESWTTASGPIVESDLYNGEYYDARKELRSGTHSWDTVSYEAAGWSAARVVAAPANPPVAKVNLPIRRQESLRAKAVRKTTNGEWVYDFGQVITGWVKLRLQGKAGQTATVRFAEMLEPDGSLHVANLRSAKSTDRYVFRDAEKVEWEPSFTYHGFRYVGLSGVEGEPGTDALEGIVFHGDLPETGFFESSNTYVNRLQQNIWWSQRGNAYDVPTDCPQRDERLGWTGDANFFLPTSTFNYDVAAFIEKWMGDLRDAQKPDGRFTVYAPAPDVEAGEAAAYSDGGVICPWLIYERYGDRRILEENYEAIKGWIEFQRKTSEGLIRPPSGYGDWLAPVTNAEGKPATPRDLIGTAYFAHTVDLMRRISDVLGRTADAATFAQLHADIVKAFQVKYTRTDGRLTDDSTTTYALALAFDLLPEASRPAAVKHIVDALKAREWKIPTGFVGTPILMRVLKRFGEDDAGYRVLLQRSYPGWMYMIDQGATTIWERWNSWTPETGFGDRIADTGFGDTRMNSFNHTVWGAVGEWMYAVIGGIDVGPKAAGFKHILIRPRPGGDLTWARAHYDSPYGRIESHWTHDRGRFALKVTIPPNTRATVWMPDGVQKEVGAGQHSFTSETPAGEERVDPSIANFSYGQDSERQKFDLWLPASKKPTPLVVLLHGGGWIRGDKSQYRNGMIKPFLEAGVAVAAVNYRFIAQAMEQGVEPPVKAPLLDAARAIQTIRHHAKEWNIDPRRIGATGGSAGACSALWLALHDDLADAKSADPIARESTRLACVATNGAQVSLDPVALREWIPNSEYAGHAFGFMADGRIRREEFALLVEQRDRLLPLNREYSPITHVSAGDPSLYLDFPNEVGVPVPGQPQRDPTHSAVQGLKLAEALEKFGIEAVVAYPAAPDKTYGSPQRFLLQKLGALPGKAL